MNALQVVTQIQPAIERLAFYGGPLQWAVVVLALAVVVAAVTPQLARLRRATLAVFTAVLLLGEGLLAWFHWTLYRLTPVVEPATGRVTGHMTVSLWVEGERLYLWALIVAVLGLLLRKERDKLLPGVMLSAAVIGALAVTTGQPFTNPIPSFLGQYFGYVQAMGMGGAPADAAWQGMEASRQFFYNDWFMWVHPPLLYFSYAAFTVSFVCTVQMILERHSKWETAAYYWARLGYLPLTFGMLLGFPWALSAWTGESWWWSGFVNMSIMMWMFYTAYLHARLYLRRAGMWRIVASLAVISFLVLVLTYLATYVVPGAHSYASLAPHADPFANLAALLFRRGGAA